jgi:hypothetical protein
MSERNIAAYTAEGSNPPYCSINESQGIYSITLRGHSPESSERGTTETVKVQLSKHVLRQIGIDILNETK